MNDQIQHDCKIRYVKENDLPLLLSWRNHPDIRKYMFTKNKIKLSEHLNWFENATSDPLTHLLIVEEKSWPIGFVKLRRLHIDDAVTWGFFAQPEADKGAGFKICSAALDFAFSALQASKVLGECFESNQASVRLHLRLGFTEATPSNPTGADKHKTGRVLSFIKLKNE